MKSIAKLFTLFFSILILMACSEDDNDFPKVASVKVVNAINGVSSVIVKIGDNPITYSTTASKVGFGASKVYGLEAGTQSELQIVPESDSLDIIYSELLNLGPSSHSLYLIGIAGSEENLLVTDDFKQFTDSIVGVRFVNLSPNSSSLNIGISGEATNTVSGLGYKDITDYLEFPAKAIDGPYAFEFKDAAGNILSTYSLNLFPPGFTVTPATKRNLTLAVIGLDDTELSITRVNNY